MLRKIIRILFITFVTSIALASILYILLWLPPVQQKIKDFALSGIMEKTQNRMRIGKLRFAPFNRLQLEDVFVEDLKGDTLLFAENMTASFDIFRLLHKHLMIYSVDLEHFVIRMNRDEPDADFNFQFFMDAFQTEKQDTAASSLLVQISNISLKNGLVSYDIRSAPNPENGVFDVNHIHICDFNAAVDLNSIDWDKPDITVKRLNFTERSGWRVARLEAELTSGEKKLFLKKLRFALPHSELAIPEASLDYTGYARPECVKKGMYTLRIGDSHIDPEDVKMFYPPLVKLDRKLIFSGTASGVFPRIDVSSLSVNYGQLTGLSLQASLSDYTRWQDTPLQLNVNTLFATPQGIKTLLAFFSKEEKKQLPVNTGTVSLSATLKGSLPEMLFQLHGITGSGQFHLNGSGGYRADSATASFDAELDAAGFDLHSLLQDSLSGRMNLHVKAQGTVSNAVGARASGTATVSRFDFNRYTYRDIQAAAVYSGDSLRLRIDSHDPNVPLQIRGEAAFTASRPEIQLYARLDSVYLDSLHLLPNYKNAYLSANIAANTSGLDVENMDFSLVIDNFGLYTDKGAFDGQQLRLHYMAEDTHRKQLDISSQIVTASVLGKFTYAGIKESLAEAFPVLFPPASPPAKKKESPAGNCRFWGAITHTHLLSDIFELPAEIPDSALFIGDFNHDGQLLTLSASAYTQFAESDTMQLSLMLSSRENRLDMVFNVDNKSNTYDLDGTLDAGIEFVPLPGNARPGMNITLNPEVWVLNGTHFDQHPAQIEVRDNRYFVHDLLLDHQAAESVKIHGVISDSPDDSLTVNVSRFRLQTVFNAVKTQLPLFGEATGEIVAKQLLSKPVILSRGFAVKQLVFAGNAIGDLNVRSAWSSERKGLFLRATLGRENLPPSTVAGYYLPEKDSLSLTANIRDIKLEWLKSFTQDALYGLDGSLNANITAKGQIRNPEINGVMYFDRARLGITQLNVLYAFSDSIYLSPDAIELKRFTIRDPQNRPLRLNGKITHRLFNNLNPNLSVSLSNFLVINNERQIDSLLYGRLRVNGLLNVKKQHNDWILSGDLTHSDDSKLMVNLPSPSATAERYNSVTFIHTEKVTADRPAPKALKHTPPSLRLPLKINVSLWLDPSLTVGAIFNPATRDAAQVKGNGSMHFSCNLSNASIHLAGNYIIESGKATLSLANLTKKTFSVQQGGKLTFLGDPLATTFDLTALYPLRADLTALDPSFENMELTSTKIPVTCALTATGSINRMELKYNLLFPNEQDEIQRKVEGLLYTDDLKIKEIAYLLALGTFMPVNGSNAQSSNNSIWTSLASSSITSQLNNLLSNVLNENWTIGTELHTKDAGFSNMNMDVNISTHLFNDRLTVNSTLGYRNDPNQTGNFTGDFNLEYRLNPSGNLLLKAYNVTNNQYYRKGKSTQGAGIIYKRGARTFGRLFDKFKKKKKNESD
jgi:hypothetical protein